MARADEVLADRQEFRLKGTQWEAFVAALDTPPRRLPRSGKLMKDPGFFDEEQ